MHAFIRNNARIRSCIKVRCDWDPETLSLKLIVIWEPDTLQTSEEWGLDFLAEELMVNQENGHEEQDEMLRFFLVVELLE